MIKAEFLVNRRAEGDSPILVAKIGTVPILHPDSDNSAILHLTETHTGKPATKAVVVLAHVSR
jgi:hypothetical protein